MNLWLPGAARVLGPHAAGGQMVGGSALCTHHVTVSKQGTFAAVRDYLVGKGYEPTLLLDPYDGHRAQFLPADRSAYALEHPAGMPETNRAGKVNVQIEWLWPDMEHDITTAPHFAEIWHDLIPWLRQLGVPDVWTFGSPLATGRDPGVWAKGGHRGHRNAPGNSHVDSLPAPKAPAWPQRTQAFNPVRRAEIAALTARLAKQRRPLPQDDRTLLANLDAQIVRALGIK